ncbi:MAG: hypothetical protein R6V60_13840 [Desulfobacterales bacterium]
MKSEVVIEPSDDGGLTAYVPTSEASACRNLETDFARPSPPQEIHSFAHSKTRSAVSRRIPQTGSIKPAINFLQYVIIESVLYILLYSSVFFISK